MPGFVWHCTNTFWLRSLWVYKFMGIICALQEGEDKDWVKEHDLSLGRNFSKYRVVINPDLKGIMQKRPLL